MVNSKQKGKRGEREFAKWLRDNWDVEARRGQQFKGTSDSPDVVTSLKGIHFEVKRTQSLSIYKALEQAEQDAGLFHPIVAHRKNGKQWVFILNAESMLAVVNAIKDQVIT